MFSEKKISRMLATMASAALLAASFGAIAQASGGGSIARDGGEGAGGGEVHDPTGDSPGTHPGAAPHKR